MQVPKGVVDRGGGQEQQFLRRAAHETVERRIPCVVHVTVCMGFVDDDEPVNVLVHPKDPSPAVGRQLPVLCQLLIGHHISGEVLLAKALFPEAVPELGGGR